MDVIDYGSADVNKQIERHAKSGPNWLKIDRVEESKRIFFLGNKLPIQWIYDINSLVEVDPKTNRGKYLGTFQSLTHEKRNISGDVIEQLVLAKDFSSLEIDAKVLKEPKGATALLALVYPTDTQGTLNADYFQRGVFELRWVRLTGAKFKSIYKFAHRAAKDPANNLNPFQTDFIITRPNKGNYEVWDFEQQSKSVFLKNVNAKISENKTLGETVQEKIQEALKEAHIKDLVEIANFVGKSLTESEWVTLLSKAGYDLSSYGVSAKVSQVPVSNTDVPVNPEMEGGLDYSGGDFKY